MKCKVFFSLLFQFTMLCYYKGMMNECVGVELVKGIKNWKSIYLQNWLPKQLFLIEKEEPHIFGMHYGMN